MERTIPTGRQRHRFEGAAAEAWFRDRGVQATPVGEAPLMVSADELVGSAYVARRIWHSASRLSRVPSELPTPEGMHEMTLVLQVHGSVELRAAAGAIVLEPHDVALYATAEHPSLTSMQPTARIELMIRHLPAFGRRAPVLLPSHGPTAASTALSSMFNGVMNHEAPLMPTLTESMAKVVESHAELLILERHALATAGGGGAMPNVRRAPLS